MSPPVRLCHLALAIACCLPGPAPARASDATLGHRVRQWEPANFVYDLAQTEDGFLWLATKAGLLRFDGVGFAEAGDRALPALPDGPVRAVHPAGGGGLWVGFAGAGLARLQGTAVQVFDRDDGLPSPHVRALLEDREGGLWVSTDRGLARLRDGAWRRVGVDDGLLDDAILSLAPDRDGAPLVETRAGLSRRVGDRFVSASLPASGHARAQAKLRLLLEHTAPAGRALPALVLPSRVTEVRAVVLDGGGDLWVGTSHGVFQVVDGALVLRALADTAVLALVAGREGDVWASGYGGVLVQVSPRRIRSYTLEDGLLSDAPFALAEAPDGSLWMTTSRGIARHHRGTLSVELAYTQDNRLAALSPRHLAITPDGLVWLQGERERALMRVEAGALRVVRLRPAGDPAPDELDALHVGPGGRLWVGTRDGRLGWREGERFVLVPLGEPCAGPCARGVVRIAERPAGGAWIATAAAGLWLWDGTRARPAAPPGALASARPLTLHAEQDGTVWIGTRRGLVRFREGAAAVVLDRRQGLADDRVHEIVVDGARDLWIGSERGIFRLRRADLDAVASGARPALVSDLYGRADGLRNEEVIRTFQPSALRTRDGRLWFSTVKGLTVIEAPERWRPLPPPRPALERLTVDGVARPVTGGDLDVPPGRGDLELHYTAPVFVEPQRVRFRHRLAGFDRDWIDTGERRAAYYTNVPPGRYRFEVVAHRSGEPGPSEAALVIGLALRPRLHQTWYFHLGVALALGLAVLAGHRLRTRQVRRRYELVWAERARIAHDLHDTLAQVFSAVGLQLDRLGALLDTPAARERLQQARRMLAHARLAARNVVGQVRAAGETRPPLPRALEELARLYEDVSMVVDVRGLERPLPEAVEAELLRIAEEAVSNAIAHGRASHVFVELLVDEGQIELWIRDDGAGFQPGPAAASEDVQPGGFGLVGMRARAARLGGTLEIASEPGVGTEVGVKVPRPAPGEKRT